jgi:hypothetical protein
MDDGILTPKERPTHHAIGRFFYAWDEQVHYCDSYDPRADFWMTNVVDAQYKRRAVSPRAIGRTYHHAQDSPKPQVPEDAIGREYFVLDTRVPPEEMAYVRTLDKDCFNLDDRIALFFFESDATKFIQRVNDAAVKLKAAVEAGVPL